MNDVQSYVHTSVDNPTFLRGKCSHCWTCVEWCKSTFAQVGDSHLPGATPFLHLAGLLQMHQPLHPLALANDSQVWGLEHICEDCLQMHTLFRGVRAHLIYQPILHLICLKLAISLFPIVFLT